MQAFASVLVLWQSCLLLKCVHGIQSPFEVLIPPFKALGFSHRTGETSRAEGPTTEGNHQLSMEVGQTLGALLNASFGNAVCPKLWCYIGIIVDA